MRYSGALKERKVVNPRLGRGFPKAGESLQHMSARRQQKLSKLDFVHYAAKQRAWAIRNRRLGGILCMSGFDGQCR
jgi:hypothetical protein